MGIVPNVGRCVEARPVVVRTCAFVAAPVVVGEAAVAALVGTALAVGATCLDAAVAAWVVSAGPAAGHLGRKNCPGETESLL